MTDLNANALVSLNVAKDHLQISLTDATQDDRVKQYINTVSDHFEAHCERIFRQQTYTHYFNGTGTAILPLFQFPVTVLTSVNIDRKRLFGAGTEATDAIIHRDFALSRKQKYIWPAYPVNVKVVYQAGYATIPSDLQEAALLMLGQLWDMRGGRSAGVASRAKLGDSVSFINELPPAVKAILDPYVRENYLKRKMAEV